MKQRIMTALPLFILLCILVALGGVPMGIATMGCVCFAMYEEFHALAMAGHRPVAWPTWVGMLASIPLVLLYGNQVVIPMLAGIFAVTAVCIIFREEPKLEDILMSTLPLTTIFLPGLCMVSVALIQPKALQVVMYGLMFLIPIGCDTMAYFVGSRIGGPKMCPAVSPNKTLSGAAAGLLGGLLTMLLVAIPASLLVDDATRAMLPTWWQYLLLGLLGSAVGQLGDLFASLVKRHCGIKDYSKLFPGHGGMLDRIDSMLFVSVLIYCFRLITT